ncbi:PAS domain-containing protein [Streptomyces sp. B6B3]|uniref:PAS domain-containing protein n=1 Tax=Streptomyces sp. B6B3 TaxID=3153570 RepID=UPI00325D8892
MAESDEFGAELTGFRKRVEELRVARTLPPEERLAAFDTALFELQYAVDVLWPRHEALEGARARTAAPSGSREQQLLRTLFQRLPLAVVLLDEDSVVRRLNFAACRLLGMRAGYATGRSLTASFRHENRAAFRSQVAAVARNEGDRSMVVELMRGVHSGRGSHQTAGGLRVTLTAVRPSGQRRSAVLAVLQPAAALPDGGAFTAPVSVEGGPRPDPGEVRRHAELMDLVDDMATALLTHRSASTDQLLLRAGRLLRGRFADWVLVDVSATDGGRLRRVGVLGPRDAAGEAATDALSGQDPSAAPLIREAARVGSSALQVSPEDMRALGEVADGTSVLALTEASSFLCMPLLLPSGTVRGVITLVRSGGRGPFRLAEASAMDRMARHVALAVLHAVDGTRRGPAAG